MHVRIGELKFAFLSLRSVAVKRGLAQGYLFVWQDHEGYAYIGYVYKESIIYTYVLGRSPAGGICLSRATIVASIKLTDIKF